MNSNAGLCKWASVTLFVLGVASGSARLGAQVASVDPAKMRRIGTVDERFQSYNIEMVEIIGGRFWKPYTTNNANTSKAQPPAQQSGSTPAGMDPNLYQYRPPIDLTNPRLLKLAAELGPAYVRVSGTWANAVYFHDFDSPAPPNAPSGFSGVLTRKEWKGVIDFSHAVNAETVTSLATSPGPRDPQGVWKPEQARQLLAYTKSVGGRIAAAVSQDWLSRPEKIGAFYAGLQDTFQPGKPLWITETADAACNGNTLRLDSSGDVPLLTG